MAVFYNHFSGFSFLFLGGVGSVCVLGGGGEGGVLSRCIKNVGKTFVVENLNFPLTGLKSWVRGKFKFY